MAYQMEIGHFEKPDGDSDDTRCFIGPTIPGCLSTDDDFDGYPYHKDWPNGSASFPSPMLQLAEEHGADRGLHAEVRQDPVRGRPAGHRVDLHTLTGAGCTNPPPGAKFYPWFHLSKTTCQWTLSNNIAGFKNFGGEVAAWGLLEVTDYGGGFIAFENYASGNLPNPCP